MSEAVERSTDGTEAGGGERAEAETESPAESPTEETTSRSTLTLRHRVGRASRWSVWLLAGFFLLALGLFYADPALVAAATAPFAYVGYAALSTLPSDLSRSTWNAASTTTGSPRATPSR